jgi:hypothetical protein
LVGQQAYSPPEKKILAEVIEKIVQILHEEILKLLIKTLIDKSHLMRSPPAILVKICFSDTEN